MSKGSRDRVWTPSLRTWWRLHSLVNRAAWKWASPGGEVWGQATRVDHSRLLWRLNDWLASRWIPEHIKRHDLPHSTEKNKDSSKQEER